MTCIVGLVHEDHTYIGADSASVNPDSLIIRQTNVPKVFKRGPFIIGYTTSFRMGQLLQHWLEVPEQGAGQSNQEYMVKEFAEAVRELFKEKGFAEIENSQESGGTFLIGYKDHLYTMHGDFQIAELSEKMDSVGCGSSFALGAMKAMEWIHGPQERIIKALEISAYYSAGVCGPFSVLST